MPRTPKVEALLPTPPIPIPPPRPRRWEYHHAEWKPLRDINFEDWLNSFGTHGWELIYWHSSAVFKREIV